MFQTLVVEVRVRGEVLRLEVVGPDDLDLVLDLLGVVLLGRTQRVNLLRSRWSPPSSAGRRSARPCGRRCGRRARAAAGRRCRTGRRNGRGRRWWTSTRAGSVNIGLLEGALAPGVDAPPSGLGASCPTGLVRATIERLQISQVEPPTVPRSSHRSGAGPGIIRPMTDASRAARHGRAPACPFVALRRRP